MLWTEQLILHGAVQMDIESNPEDPHLDTGIFGTKYILTLLTDNGYGELAYQIANQTTYPSWGYLIENGADTYYETWELSARSYDHYFLGTADDWFYKDLAGIRTERDGLKEITIKPSVLGDLTYAAGELNTARGKVSSEWILNDNNTLDLSIEIPVNTTAVVYIPAKAGATITEDGMIEGVSYLRSENGYEVYQVGSESYHFYSQI